MEDIFESAAKEYEQACQSATIDALLQAINFEEQTYFRLLHEHYDDCAPFFCRSDEISVENMPKELMDRKANLNFVATRQLRVILLALKKHGKALLLSDEYRLYYLADIADAYWVMANSKRPKLLQLRFLFRISAIFTKERALRYFRV